MCFPGGGGPQPTATAAAPAPAEPAPKETQIGDSRQQENLAKFGTAGGPDTRVDRSLNVSPGSGLRM